MSDELKFHDCECGAKDEDISLMCVHQEYTGELFIVRCSRCHYFVPFKTHSVMYRDTMMEQAIKAWNPRPDSKPYKWENPFDALCNYGEGACDDSFTSGFNAARELKEG